MSLALLGDQMLYVVLPAHPEAAGIGVAALGLVLSANRFIRLAANPLAGWLSDRLGRRRPYLLGMALAAASTGMYLAAASLWPLLAGRLVWGAAFALFSVGGLAIVLDVSPPHARGRGVGLYQSLVQCGTLLGLVLSGVLHDRIGYRGTLRVYTPLTAVGGLLAWLTVRDTSPGRAHRAALRRRTPRHPRRRRAFGRSGPVGCSPPCTRASRATSPAAACSCPRSACTCGARPARPRCPWRRSPACCSPRAGSPAC